MTGANDRIVDEASLFTEDEYAAAFQPITTPEEAHDIARSFRTGREPSDNGPQWVLAPEVLDLLSLVSDDCAERVARIFALVPEEARKRRARVAAWLAKGPG